MWPEGCSLASSSSSGASNCLPVAVHSLDHSCARLAKLHCTNKAFAQSKLYEIVIIFLLCSTFIQFESGSWKP